jgi:hypothetical protein
MTKIWSDKGYAMKIAYCSPSKINLEKKTEKGKIPFKV